MKKLLVCIGLLLGMHNVHAQTYDVRCAMRKEDGKKVNEPARFIYNKDKNVVIYSRMLRGEEMNLEFSPQKSHYENHGAMLNKFMFNYKIRNNPQQFLFTIVTNKPIDTKIADVEVSFNAAWVNVRPDGLAENVYIDDFTSCKYTYFP